MSKDNRLDEILDKINYKLKPVEMRGVKFTDEIVIIGKTKAKKELNKYITSILDEELKLLKSYDWYGTDDKGNENVYFNDEICQYADQRLKEIKDKYEG